MGRELSAFVILVSALTAASRWVGRKGSKQTHSKLDHARRILTPHSFWTR